MKLLYLILLSALRVAFVGDPQVDNAAELSYARNSIYSELRARKDLDLVVILGDLVNENTNLIAPSEASLDSLSCPWFRVNGNHDGPDPVKDTSFSVSGTRFILMDNVRRTEKGYVGGFSEKQKEWLDSLTRNSKENIVLCTHIPLSQSKGRDSLQTIFSKCPSGILLVCGHTHQVMRHQFTDGIEEVIAGATCGSWWRGKKDADGIPYALMNCGAPRGYFVADFSHGKYKLQYKTVGSPISASTSVLENKLYINVYGGSVDGTVKVKFGTKWIAADRVEEIAPEVREIILANTTTPREYRKSHKDEFIPLRRLKSPHLWCIAIPEGGKATHPRIKYSDPSMTIRKQSSFK